MRDFSGNPLSCVCVIRHVYPRKHSRSLSLDAPNIACVCLPIHTPPVSLSL